MRHGWRRRRVTGAAIALLAFAGAYWRGGVLVTALALDGCSRSEAAPSENTGIDARSRSTIAPATSSPVPAPAAALELAASKIDGKNFRVEASPHGECKAGGECSVLLRLEALGEYHINKEYPYKFRAERGDGTLEYLGKDASGTNIFSKSAGDFKTEGEQKAVMTVRFKAAKAGDATVTGVYKLSVCSAQNCQLESPRLALVVAVK
jgi:hypothetical protein